MAATAAVIKGHRYADFWTVYKQPAVFPRATLWFLSCHSAHHPTLVTNLRARFPRVTLIWETVQSVEEAERRYASVYTADMYKVAAACATPIVAVITTIPFDKFWTTDLQLRAARGLFRSVIDAGTALPNVSGLSS
jgi:hypothetical protein